MKQKTLKLFTVLFLLLYMTTIGWAVELPEYSGDIYVQDFAQIMSENLEDEIKDTARSIDDQTTAQIAVVTIKSLEGNDIEGYANELLREWEIGSKDKDNGVLFLIALEEQKFRIEVGYGLEGRINDGKAGDILRESATYFQQGKIDQGIAVAFNKLAQEIGAEYEITAPQVSETPTTVKKVKTRETKTEKTQLPLWAKALLVAAFIYLAIFHPDLLLTLIYMFGRGGGGSGGGSGGSRRGGGGSSGGGGASGGW